MCVCQIGDPSITVIWHDRATKLSLLLSSTKAKARSPSNWATVPGNVWKTRKIDCQNHQNYPNDQGLAYRRVVLGVVQGSSAVATAAGGRLCRSDPQHQTQLTSPDRLAP